MKTSLEHLPASKQQEIRFLTEGIVNYIEPEMIILFGSYSRGNWVEEIYTEGGIIYEYKSDYDILVITRSPKEQPPGLEDKLIKRIKKEESLQTAVEMIFHDIDYLNNELEEGQYFFSDIVKEGTMLYDSGNFQLAKPKKLTGAQRAALAQGYYDKWYRSASNFYEDFENNYNKGEKDHEYLPNSIFNLHQAAERFYVAIALVFTGYKPKTHDLKILNKKAVKSDIEFKAIFPNETTEDKRLFGILVKAYIDSRYKMNYKVDKDELKWLGSRVLLLKELTEKICLEKIEALGKME